MNLVNRLLPTTSPSADPDAPALMAGEMSLTYRQLGDLAGQWRGGLVGAGIGPGDRVAVLAGNEEVLVLAELAAVGLGAVLVPLNPQAPPAELDRDLAAVVPAGILVGLGGEPSWQRLVAERPDWAAQRLDHRRWTGPDGPTPVPVADVDPAAPAVLLFTSGTAGASKPAVLTHGNLDAALRSMHALPLDLAGGGHVSLAVIPLFHIFGLHALVGLSLSAGACVVLADYRDPEQVADLVERHQVTILAGPPNLWQALAADPGLDRRSFASVRIALSGAAKLDPGIWRAVHERLGLRLAEGYGLTETCAVAATSAGSVEAPVGSVGPPMAGVEVRLVDPDGADVLVGDPGEIWVRGPMVSPGYFRAGASPDQVAGDDGWLRTGDIGVVDDDGNLAIVDRRKDLVIVSGFNVYPVEVEQVLAAHPEVAAAAVVGRPDPVTGEAVVAHVVPVPGANPDPVDLIGHCRDRLARYKVPARIEIRAELPLALGGKIRRHQLR